MQYGKYKQAMACCTAVKRQIQMAEAEKEQEAEEGGEKEEGNERGESDDDAEY